MPYHMVVVGTKFDAGAGLDDGFDFVFCYGFGFSVKF
jgi:hypothetical protein